jgi:hypothetical protein
MLVLSRDCVLPVAISESTRKGWGEDDDLLLNMCMWLMRVLPLSLARSNHSTNAFKMRLTYFKKASESAELTFSASNLHLNSMNFFIKIHQKFISILCTYSSNLFSESHAKKK